MATILENESAWSTTPATNANVDTGINWAENQDAATVNNSARGMMSARAKARLDQGGALTAGGTANALTVTTNQVLSAAHLAAGQRLLLRASANNTTTAVTFAPDGLTARSIKRADGSALAVGSIKSGMDLDLVYNAGSSEWRAANISAIAKVVTRTITATGTYTPSAGMIYATIECVGGGGGGGGAQSAPANAQGTGGGGGSGGYSRATVTAAQVGASLAVTIGAAGTAGTGPANGVAGGTSSVGSVCIANGGSGGAFSTTVPAAGAGGAGGVVAGAVGDFVLAGQNGFIGAQIGTSAGFVFPCGDGGRSYFGPTYGSGGTGATSRNSGGAATGTAGTAGVVVITEFC